MKMILITFQKKKKKKNWGKWAILGPKMVHPLYSRFSVRIFFKFCTMKRYNRYMKVIIMVFTKNV